MHAAIQDDYGQPLRIDWMPTPIPGDDQVLVRVRAAGLNPLDTKIRAGKAAHAKQPLPAVLAMDMAGTVVAVGSGVKDFRVGDDVFGMVGGVGGVQGALAEYMAVDPALLAPKPAALSMREAAALPLVFITAWEGLVDRANVAPAMSVLIHGGAGGIGHVAIQIARAFGATVFATGKASQQDVIEQLGATFIDYQQQSVTQYVDRHSKGEGFDIIFDTVGGSTLDDSFQAVRPYRGHVVSALGWGNHSLAPLSFRAGTYSGVFTLMPLQTGRYREHHGSIMREAARLADEGALKPRLDPTRFTLDTAEQAYRWLETGAANGKVVVTVTE
nr:zinc-dependent alcohol dehydrogenase family protein [Permianibacter fluminis]